MTILSMITLSALTLMCLSHVAALRAQKQKQVRKALAPARINYPGRR